MSSYSIPFTFENIKERVFDHLHLLREILYYIISFSGKFYQWKVWYYYILKVFEGNLKNVCQKAIKTNSTSSRNKSKVPMFYYHVIKMNEV